MINFTVGPVESNEAVLTIGGEQVPYFRTPEFSDLMLENERLILEYANAPKESRVTFITGSGTASMEAAVINALTKNDRVLVINGGGFGQRFVEILTLYEVPFEEVKLSLGQELTRETLNKYAGLGFTALIVNMHETSIGVLYDINMIGEFCESNNLFFIVDAISAFLADDIDMEKMGIDIMITGSQKALACPPGVSLLVLSPDAVERIERIPSKCMYLDLKTALLNGKRGQTPYTPAVGILIQINARLKQIAAAGGAKTEIKRTADLASYFRREIAGLPFEISSHKMSNAVTPLKPLTASAHDIFIRLKDEYNIWICPNGGELKDSLFRVGHIGELTKADYDILISAFKDLQARGLI